MAGRRNGGYERGTLERALPYASTVIQTERANVFDGTETNFGPWKWRMQNRLTKMKLLYVLTRTPEEEDFFQEVEGATPEQEEDRKAKLQKRLEDDVEALDEIVMAVNNDVLNILIGLNYAKEAMDTLIRTYEKAGTAAMVNMRERLFSLKYRHRDSSLRTIFDEYDLIIRELGRMNSGITQEEKIHALLSAIPDRFKHVKGALLVLSNEELCRKSTTEIKRMFFDAEAGEEKAKEKNPPNIALKSKKEIRCFGCNETGHYYNKCPLMKKFKAKEKEKFQKEQKEKNGKRTHAMMTKSQRKRAERSKRVRFVVDSGASDHMVNDERLLEEVKELQEPVTITTAKTGENLRATKVGKLRLTSVVGKTSINKLELYNVLFIPKLEENLLSVRKASLHGKRVTFTEKEVIFENQDEIIGKGKFADGLFYLDCIWDGKSDDISDGSAYFGKQVSLETWHKRLGHLSTAGLEKLIKKGMVEGINPFKGENYLSDVCDGCLAGKQAAFKFQEMKLPRSKRPLELVHTDVCGSMEQETYDGYRYFVTFIDDYTHFVVVYLMKHKSEVFERFKEYEAMASAHFETRISKLRCDNGGEYTSNEFQRHCKQKGIQMIYTVPYTPQQNGVSERMNRSLMEKVRAMLHESGLPKKMWGEALYAATYLLNRSPTKGLEADKTPYEMWFNKRPNLKHLRIFGCKAFKQIPKEKCQKLDAKTKSLIFVGYANNGFRLWNDETHSIEIGRNVVFDESSIVYRGYGMNEIEPGEQDLILCTQFQIKDNNKDLGQEQEQGSDSEESISEKEQESNSSGSASDENPIEEETLVEQNQDQVEHKDVTSEESVGETDYESANEADEEDDANQQELRRSQRDRKPPNWYSDYSARMATIQNGEIPQNIKDLKELVDWEEWKQALKEELDALHSNNTWTVVNCVPKGVKPIYSKWIFSLKEDGRHKARLVAKGCSQRPGFDYSDTFAPVAKLESVRLALALANEHKLHVHQMDVKTAFLNGQLEEEIFMKLPPNENGQSQIVRLNKSLYGLKQASRSWNKRFNDAMEELGFIPLKSDCCIYKSKFKGIILILYVDDILIIAKNIEEISWIKEKLGRLFQMKDLSEVKHFLGMEINRDFENQIIEISQKQYVERLLERFGMAECKPVGTPLDCNTKWSKSEGEYTEQPYRELVGCLQYLSLTSRPDICAAVNKLSKYTNCATDWHWSGLKRILRYLRGTSNTKIVYTKHEKVTALVGFGDADFANDPDDRKSVSGYAYQLYGNLISWSTKRQPTISLSTSEAELIALCAAAKEGMWITKLLNELDVVITPFIIMEDSIPCISIAEEPRSHQRMKHLDIKYLFIRDLIRKGRLKLQFIPSVDQPADAFTKGLPKSTHRKLFDMLNVQIEGKC